MNNQPRQEDDKPTGFDKQNTGASPRSFDKQNTGASPRSFGDAMDAFITRTMVTPEDEQIRHEINLALTPENVENITNKTTNIVTNNDDDETWYYEQDGSRLPLTIDFEANPADQQDHLTNTITNLPHERKTITNIDNIPKIVSPYKERNGVVQRQLTDNLVANVTPSTNIMNPTNEPITPTRQVPGNGLVVVDPADNVPRRRIPEMPAVPSQATITVPTQRIPEMPTLPGQATIMVPTQRIPEMPTVPTQATIMVPTQRIPEMPTLPAQGNKTLHEQRINPPVSGVRHILAPEVPQILTTAQVSEAYRNDNYRGAPVVRTRVNVPLTPNFNPVRNVVPEVKKITPVIPEVNKAPLVLNVAVPLPERNPYLLLPKSILDAIAAERDVTITGNDKSRAEQLFQLDNIMSDWIQSVLTKNIENFQVLTGAKLYVFGALHGVSFNNIGRLSNRDLMHYIRISILLANPNHPGRVALPGILKDVDRKLLEVLSGQFGIRQGDLRFITTNDLMKVITTGKRDHIPMEAIIALGDRYRLLKENKYKSQLADLYGIDAQDDDAWLTIARLAPHPMESVIIQLDSFDVNDIISKFQMAIPLMYSNNIKQYIQNNIVSYAQILTRGNLDPLNLNQMKNMTTTALEQYLNKLTDIEIHIAFGIYLSYDSRSELIRKMIASIRTSCFLYPTSRLYERAYNHTTIGLSDITDTTVFMVGYGTAVKYHVYELDDLRAAFTRNDETGAFSFRRPEAPNTTFTINDIECLRQLLGCFPSTPEGIALTQLIDTALIDARETTKYDEETRRQLQTFAKPIRDIIQQFLKQVFYIGMYMRRWEGPGHPFPLKKDDTKRKIADEELDALVKRQIEPAVALLTQMGPAAMNYCLQLRLCEYKQDGGIDIGNIRFEGEWHDVGKGKQCIRMASSKFVGTAYHYLRILFRETIPGMDVKGVDRIL